MRFIIKDITLSSKHPMFPGAVGYKIYDRNTYRYGGGFYTTLEAAQEMCAKKNERWSNGY